MPLRVAVADQAEQGRQGGEGGEGPHEALGRQEIERREEDEAAQPRAEHVPEVEPMDPRAEGDEGDADVEGPDEEGNRIDGIVGGEQGVLLPVGGDHDGIEGSCCATT